MIVKPAGQKRLMKYFFNEIAAANAYVYYKQLLSGKIVNADGIPGMENWRDYEYKPKSKCNKEEHNYGIRKDSGSNEHKKSHQGV